MPPIGPGRVSSIVAGSLEPPQTSLSVAIPASASADAKVNLASVRVVGSRPTSTSQGHNQLVQYLAAAGHPVACWSGSAGQRLVARLYRATADCGDLSPARVYQRFLAHFYLGSPGSRDTYLHFIWGDDLVAKTVHPERSIFTLHQPYEFWDDAKWARITRCAGIVCMAERERDEIRRRCPHTPVAFIPHGIDTDFWRPVSSRPRRQVCAVGRYLRNFGMLLRVARALLDRYPDLTFAWVVNPGFQLPGEFAALIPPRRFRILRDLSAAELHRVYAESWAFFTPYNQVAGSNAIVEAMASGTPVFTTRVGGIDSYRGDDALTVVENNDDAAAVTALSACLASPSLRAAMGARARRHAERHLRWPAVVRAHQEFYRQILAKRQPHVRSISLNGAAALPPLRS